MYVVMGLSTNIIAKYEKELSIIHLNTEVPTDQRASSSSTRAEGVHSLPRYDIGIRVIHHAGTIDRVEYPWWVSGHIRICVLILGISKVTTNSVWSNGSDISRPNAATLATGNLLK